MIDGQYMIFKLISAAKSLITGISTMIDRQNIFLKFCTAFHNLSLHFLNITEKIINDLNMICNKKPLVLL